LGSTGSVGTKTLEICKNLNIKVVALSAGKNVKLLEKQARKFNPEVVSVISRSSALELRTLLKDTFIKVLYGKEGLLEVASYKKSDTVLNAISGMSGLEPTVVAIKAKKNIAIANKESIVAAGEIILQLARENHVKIIPVDSEHSAIFQCLECAKKIKHVKKFLLTASGGPFFGKTRKELKNVTLQDALCHPNWDMGKKITIDSASFLNKGLELIEACKLFNIAPENIEIIVHKESIIHSMVQFKDSSVIAQAAVADMRLPIQYALTWPNRYDNPNIKNLDFTKLKSLTFAKPDEKTFKLLSICRKAANMRGTAPAFIISVSELVVEFFIKKEISFLNMMDLIERAFENYKFKDLSKIGDALETKNEALELVCNFSNL
jgi:1-deoxy-D-xylulose-5-phosphate reductoisomerase